MMDTNTVIPEIRSFNRFYTNILGLLNQHLLDSSYSLTEVRILLEIDKMKDCTANALMARLNVDKGYLSRILKRFETARFIVKGPSALDGRTFFLNLTPAGKQILAELEAKSDGQVEGLIHHLNGPEREKLIQAMHYIIGSLSSGLRPVTIRTFQPNDIEYVIHRHREVYSSEYGFSSDFGDYVAGTVSEFAAGYDKTKENLWIAEISRTPTGVLTPVGVLAVVKVDDATAQLRWFLIESEMRGQKLGHRLMKTALDFCKEAGYTHVLLWTVSILGAARHLYQHYGFTVTETKDNNTWSKDILIEERWDLDL